MTSADWWDFALMGAIAIVVLKLVFWLPLKALRIERDAAMKQVRASWRRTWARLGRIEAARKGAKKR